MIEETEVSSICISSTERVKRVNMYRIETYIKLAIIFSIIISVIYLPILFALKKKGRSIIRQLSYLALGCSVFIIIFATILFVLPITFNPEQHFLSLIPFQRVIVGVNVSRTIIAEMIPNVLMFIPFGIFIPIVFIQTRKLHKTALSVFLFTFSIEFLQYFIGRKSDIDDIITNLLGGIIGYGIYKFFNHLFKNKNWWHNFIKELKEQDNGK